jgi:hypothetical protein
VSGEDRERKEAEQADLRRRGEVHG